MNDSECNGLQEIIDKAIEEMAREAGDSFDVDHMNLAEFSRRTGLSRSKARSLKAKGFIVTPHGRCGMKAETTVISGFEGVVNALLMEGVTNSEVVFERIECRGYKGGKTTVKNYITAHADLVPAKRRLAKADPQGSRANNWDEFFTGDDTLLCTLDRLFDRASVFVMKGASFRGAELEIFSVESSPMAIKMNK